MSFHNDPLIGYANAQQFMLYKDVSKWPMMQYKILYRNSDWLPKENGGTWLWQETVGGCLKVLSSTHNLLPLQTMRNFKEVSKGFGGLVNLWNT